MNGSLSRSDLPVHEHRPALVRDRDEMGLALEEMIAVRPPYPLEEPQLSEYVLQGLVRRFGHCHSVAFDCTARQGFGHELLSDAMARKPLRHAQEEEMQRFSKASRSSGEIFGVELSRDHG